MFASNHKSIHYKVFFWAESAKDDAKVGVRWARFDASSLTAGAQNSHYVYFCSRDLGFIGFRNFEALPNLCDRTELLV